MVVIVIIILRSPWKVLCHHREDRTKGSFLQEEKQRGKGGIPGGSGTCVETRRWGVPGETRPSVAVGQTRPREAEWLRRRSTDTERLCEDYPGRGRQEKKKKKERERQQPEAGEKSAQVRPRRSVAVRPKLDKP